MILTDSKPPTSSIAGRTHSVNGETMPPLSGSGEATAVAVTLAVALAVAVVLELAVELAPAALAVALAVELALAVVSQAIPSWSASRPNGSLGSACNSAWAWAWVSCEQSRSTASAAGAKSNIDAADNVTNTNAFFTIPPSGCSPLAGMYVHLPDVVMLGDLRNLCQYVASGGPRECGGGMASQRGSQHGNRAYLGAR